MLYTCIIIVVLDLCAFMNVVHFPDLAMQIISRVLPPFIMWPLTLKRMVVSQKQFERQAHDVLKYLHELESLVRLNPLFKSIDAHPSKAGTYIITDNLTVFGFIRTTTTFECEWTQHEMGADAVVSAGAGTIVRSSYRLGEDGVVRDESEVEVRVLSARITEQHYNGGTGFIFPYSIHSGDFGQVASRYAYTARRGCPEPGNVIHT